MNILDKLENIEVNEDDILTLNYDEDLLKACKTEEENYLKTLEFCKETLCRMEKICEEMQQNTPIDKQGVDDWKRPKYETFIKQYKGFTKSIIMEECRNLHYEFFDRVYRRVENLYNVNLDKSEIREKVMPYKTRSWEEKAQEDVERVFSYKDVLKEILNNLDGVSFAQRGFNELQKKVRGVFIDVYHNRSRTSLHKNKLTVDHVYDGGFSTVENALCYFQKQENNYGLYYDMKHYKNGKLEFKFIDNGTALKFCDLFNIFLKQEESKGE